MTSGWRDRDADKQVRSRRINEWTEDDHLAGPVRCECRDPACAGVLVLTRIEYESVRAHAARFIVAPNHENPESERVVQETVAYAVVESVTGEGARRARRSYAR